MVHKYTKSCSCLWKYMGIFIITLLTVSFIGSLAIRDPHLLTFGSDPRLTTVDSNSTVADSYLTITDSSLSGGLLVNATHSGLLIAYPNTDISLFMEGNITIIEKKAEFIHILVERVRGLYWNNYVTFVCKYSLSLHISLLECTSPASLCSVPWGVVSTCCCEHTYRQIW